MLTLCTWLWHDKHGRWNAHSPYTAESVQRWAIMVSGALTIPHRLVVITDQPELDFGPLVTPVRLWDDLAATERCWRRLKFFSPEMRELLGDRIAWCDLDCVVTGNLDSVLSRPNDEIVLWAPGTTRCPFNGSIVLMTAGARAQVWETFPGIEQARKIVQAACLPGSDQAWIAHVLGPYQPIWTQQHGVMPYWRDCAGHLPKHARIVFFPGSLKANGSYVREHSPWVQETLNAALSWDQPAYRWGDRVRLRAKDFRRAAARAKMERLRAHQR